MKSHLQSPRILAAQAAKPAVSGSGKIHSFLLSTTGHTNPKRDVAVAQNR